MQLESSRREQLSLSAESELSLVSGVGSLASLSTIQHVPPNFGDLDYLTDVPAAAVGSFSTDAQQGSALANSSNSRLSAGSSDSMRSFRAHEHSCASSARAPPWTLHCLRRGHRGVAQIRSATLPCCAPHPARSKNCNKH